MTRLVSTLTTGLIVGAFVALGAAAPANAEPGVLPADNKIFAIDCDNNNVGLMWQVDPTTAALDPIGEPTPDLACAGPAAFDLTSGLGYWIEWSEVSTLMTADPATGALTPVGVFTEAGTDNTIFAASIAIGADGSAYVIGGTGDYDNELFSLDLDTAELTYIGDIGGDEGWWSFAFNPADGKFYGYDVNEFGFSVIDVVAATATSIVSDDDSPLEVYGIAFDSSGNVWGFGEPDGSDDWLLFTTTATSYVDDFTTIGVPEEEGEYLFSESLFITYPAPVAPEPALAATGSELPLTAGFIAFGLLAVGAAAIVITRRRTA